MVQGQPIREYRFRQPPLAQVSIPLAFEEHQARTAAGLTIEQYAALPGIRQYVDPQRGGLSKSEIVAQFRAERLIEAIFRDLENDAAARRR